MFICLFISDFAMSNEIKDNEDIPSDEKVNQDNHEQSQEIEQLPSSENEQVEEKVQETSVDDKPAEEKFQEPSADDKQETEPSLLTSNEHEIPLEPPPSTDVINDKEEEPTPATITEENTSTEPVSEKDDTVRSESSDDTPKLLQIIANKPNKEASSTILNTVRLCIPFYLIFLKFSFL
jgi:hypothetical protein